MQNFCFLAKKFSTQSRQETLKQHPDESGQTNLILTQSREVAKETQSIFYGFPLRNLCVWRLSVSFF
jgi:hypothetical protein